MADAIRQQRGARYLVGSEGNMVMFKSGTSADYAAGRDNIPLAFTVFAPRHGVQGWEVPASSINEIVDDIFAGIAALGTYVARNP